MKKWKLLVLTSSLLSSISLAETIETKGPHIKLKGIFDFHVATRVQDLPKNKENLSPNRKDFVLYNRSTANAEIEDKYGSITYGARICLTATGAPFTAASWNGTHGYIKGDFGSFEFGSPHDAASKMMIDQGEVTAGMRGASVGYIESNPDDLKFFDMTGDSFADTILPGLRTKDKSIALGGREPSRKISYYTSVFNGLQFGISFIPDSFNGGLTKDPTSPDTYSDVKMYYWDPTVTPGEERKLLSYKIRQGVTNGISLGGTYEKQVSEDVSFKLALTGELGTAIQKGVAFKEDGKDDSVVPDEVKDELTGRNALKDLRAWNVGGVITCGKMSYAASYGTIGDSFTSAKMGDYYKDLDTYFYTAGMNYNEGPMNVSLGYQGGSNKGKKFNVWALGTDYKFAPALTGYAEASYMFGEGDGMRANKQLGQFIVTSSKFSGAAFVLGLKLTV